MNKFKFIAEEEIKKKQPVVKDCTNCPNDACSKLQALAEIDMPLPQDEILKLYNFQIKQLKDKCTWQEPKEQCDACHNDDVSTVQRSEIGSYLCDECYQRYTALDTEAEIAIRLAQATEIREAARRRFTHTNEERATAERITQALEQQRGGWRRAAERTMNDISTQDIAAHEDAVVMRAAAEHALGLEPLFATSHQRPISRDKFNM